MPAGVLSRLQLFLARRKWRTSKNAAFVDMRDMDWYYLDPHHGKNNLQQDTNDSLIAIRTALGVVKYSESDEYRESQRGSYDAITAFALYYQRILPETTTATESDAYLKSLKNAWKSGIPRFLLHAMQTSLQTNNITVRALPQATAYFKDGHICLDAELSDIGLVKNHDKNEYPIWGQLTAHFVLEHDKFRLVDVSASNPFLKQLCFKKRVALNDAMLQTQQNENELHDALNQLFLYINLLNSGDKKSAPALKVANEVRRLMSSTHRPLDVKLLHDVVLQTSDYIAGVTSTPTKLEALAKKIGQRPWGKLLASAMLVLVGVVLAVTSSALLGFSGGSSSAGLISGSSMVATGTFLLFHYAKQPALTKPVTQLSRLKV